MTSCPSSSGGVPAVQTMKEETAYQSTTAFMMHATVLVGIPY